MTTTGESTSDQAAFFPDDGVSSTLTLADGRKLGYAEFGSRTGRPIVLHHGLACSRLDGAYFHRISKELHIRIICIDRPGMGWSTAQPTRTLLGFAQDVEALAQHLELNKLCVMGMSGGGPSVLACAQKLPPTRLKAVAMIVALGPPDIGMKGARLVNRIGFPYGFRVCPPFLNRWFWRTQPIGRIDLSDEERLKMILEQVEDAKSAMSDEEYKAMQDRNFHCIGLQSTREGFAQGYDGVLVDARLCCLNFGFKVEDIRPDLPVHLWYGKQDVLVPPIHGVEMAKRLGNRAQLRLEEETHVSLAVNWQKEILENLVATL